MPAYRVNKDLVRHLRRIIRRDGKLAADEYLFDTLQFAPLGATVTLCSMIVEGIMALTDDDIARADTIVMVVVKDGTVH